jgi:hypothetical protein
MALILGGAIPMYVPPPTIAEPTPEPTVDFDKWQAISDKYFSEYQDNGNFFTALDDSINETIPGGWATVAAIALPQLAPFLTGAALTAAEAAALSAGVSGTSSIIQGDPIDVALQKAALSGAGSYGGQYLAGNLGESIALPSETPYIDIPDGEFLLTPDIPIATLPSDDATRLAQIVNAFENPTELTGPTIDVASRTNVPINLQDGLIPTYDFSPDIPIQNVSPEYDPTSYLVPEGNEFAGMSPTDLARLDYTPAGNEFAGMTPTDLASLDSTGIYTPSGNEFAGMTSQDLARLDYTPAGNEFAGMTSADLASLDSTGTGSFSISPMQALRGLSLAKSLLGSGQEQAAAPATQFRGTRKPSGQVDYSGILGLLQMQSPQRRSLLG